MTAPDDMPLPVNGGGPQQRPPRGGFLRRNGVLVLLVVSLAGNAGLGGYLLGRSNTTAALMSRDVMHGAGMGPERMGPERMGPERMGPERMGPERMGPEKMGEREIRRLIRQLPESARPAVIARLAAARGELQVLQREAVEGRRALLTALSAPDPDPAALDRARAATLAASTALQARLQAEIVTALMEAPPEVRIEAAAALAIRLKPKEN